jgi:putative PIN family toxin of toxin-antitoxin system
MRAVFDTNLVVSGLLWKGKPHHVLQAASAGRVEAVTSEDLVDELRDVLKRPKLAKYIQRVSRTEEALVTGYLSYTGVVEPVTIQYHRTLFVISTM